MTNTTLDRTEITFQSHFKVGNAGKLAAQKLQEASALEKKAKALKAEAKELLADVLPLALGNKGTFGNNVIVKVQHGTSTTTNLELLAEAFPEAYAATVTRSGYLYYRI